MSNGVGDVFGGSWLQGVAIGIGVGYLHATVLSLPEWTAIVVMVLFSAIGSIEIVGDRIGV